MDLPDPGSRVKLWPATDRVAYPGKSIFLPADGDEVMVGDYWLSRLRDGSVFLHDPRPPTE